MNYSELDHIKTPKIEIDISDTQDEIDIIDQQLTIFMKNPTANKVEIYKLEGRKNMRLDFIKKLNNILEYRKNRDK